MKVIVSCCGNMTHMRSSFHVSRCYVCANEGMKECRKYLSFVFICRLTKRNVVTVGKYLHSRTNAFQLLSTFLE